MFIKREESDIGTFIAEQFIFKNKFVNVYWCVKQSFENLFKNIQIIKFDFENNFKFIIRSHF